MQRVVVPIAGIAASVGVIHYAPLPFAWLGLLWAALLGYGVVRSRTNARKLVCLYAALVPLVVGAVEARLWLNQRERGQLDYSERYAQPDEILGYAPRKGQIAHSMRREGGRVVYDVTYTIGDDGLRIAPPYVDGPDGPCVIFFGDSVTFGEGLDDAETMPYRTGIETGGRYRIYNFGFHGYGPHQMLAALERGLVANVIACEPRYAFYLAIFDHVSRVAGLRSWDVHGPRYALRGDDVVLNGHFDDGALLPAWIRDEMAKSLIVESMWERPEGVGPRDVELFVAIVDAARRRFERQYPGAEFHVLQWGDDGGLAGRAWHELVARGLRVHRCSEALPGGSSDGYTISERDQHPNARAHALLARYVARIVTGDKADPRPGTRARSGA